MSIVKETIMINDKPVYKVHSDKNVYIKNKENGTLWSSVNSCVDFEYEETDKIIEEESNN